MKIYLSIFTILFSFTLLAQNATERKWAEYYADEAAKEFNLSDEKRDQVMQAKLDHFAKSKEIRQQESDPDKRKELMQPLNQATVKTMLEITGAPIKDFRPWNQETNKKMYQSGKN